MFSWRVHNKFHLKNGIRLSYASVTVITPRNAKEFIRTILLKDFYELGKVSAEKLKQAGVLTKEEKSLSII